MGGKSHNLPKSFSLHKAAWASTPAIRLPTESHAMGGSQQIRGRKGLLCGVLAGFTEVTPKGSRDRRPRAMEGIG